MCGGVCARECRCPQRPEASNLLELVLTGFVNCPVWVLGIELGKHAFLTAEILTMLTTPTIPLRGITPAILVGSGRKRRRPSQWSVISKLKKRKSLAAGRKPWRRKLRSTLGPPQSAAHAGCRVRPLTDSGPLRGVAGAWPQRAPAFPGCPARATAVRPRPWPRRARSRHLSPLPLSGAVAAS